MILYHGSNVEVKEIDLNRSEVGKDFGLKLMEEHQLSISDALDAVYNSDTYEKILDLGTGLFAQSTVYVYAILQRELKEGKIVAE